MFSRPAHVDFWRLGDVADNKRSLLAYKMLSPTCGDEACRVVGRQREERVTDRCASPSSSLRSLLNHEQDVPALVR